MPGMRWKSIALAGALSPTLAGCTIAYNTARNIVNEPHVVWTEHAIEHDLRKAAQVAWEEVKGQCAEHADSSEFHEGFVDGYVDYLDRGGNGSLPAVPPSKFTRQPKYFTENGQCLVKQYFLGFKYGQEVAIATGRRQFLTVPVLLPQPAPEPPRFDVQPPGTAPMMPLPKPPAGAEPLAGVAKESPVVVVPPAPVPPPPLPLLPVPKPLPKQPPPPEFHPTLKSVPQPISKGPPPPEFSPNPMPEPQPDPDQLPVPASSLPPAPSGPGVWGGLPEIPPVPTPTSPIRNTPAVLSPTHTLPPPLAPNHPNPRN
jgi:hypothetical protein